MSEHEHGVERLHDQTPGTVESHLKGTFDNLPAESKVLIGLFAALNSAAAVTRRFELPDHLWETVRFGAGGPLVNQSEEANWLKGVTDGILLMIDHM